MHWSIFTECYIVAVSSPISNSKVPGAKLQSEIHRTSGEINKVGEVKQQRCKEKQKDKTTREV
jgi:Tfp pilus assembly protein PilN